VFGLVPLLWLARLPCLPVELGTVPTTPEAPPPALAPAPAQVASLPPPPRPRPWLAPLPAPLAMRERARYRVDYGVLNIGEVSLTIDGPGAGLGAPAGVDGGGPLVRAAGHGAGSVLGLGRLESHVDAEFDAARLASRRWSSARRHDDESVRDVADQPRMGQLDLVRVSAGKPPQRRHALTAGPALDPVGFLLRVRVAPPPAGAPQVLHVLDGQALWRVTLASAGREPPADGVAGPGALRFEGRADPIRYDGSPDEGRDRQRRDFVLWLSDDAARVPLRFEMPVGIATLVVALTDLDRVPAR
jgi:hypothetical protein